MITANDHGFHHLGALRLRASRPWFTGFSKPSRTWPFRSPTPRARRAPPRPTAWTISSSAVRTSRIAWQRGEFLEYAEVFGNYYGTNRETFESATRQGKDLVLDIDVQGARQLKVAIPQAISIFVLPPSRDVLEQRLRSRSQDSEEVIQRRLRGAAEEVQNYTQYDFVLINRDIEEASARLANIVEAERLRKARMEEEVGPILESFKIQSKER